MLLDQAIGHRSGGIRAPVINDEKLVRYPEPLQHRHELFYGRAEILGFVVRHDDGRERRRRQWCCRRARVIHHGQECPRGAGDFKRAGLPMTVLEAATSRITTAPMPISAPSPT